MTNLPSHIWHLRGSEPGPRVLVLGGTHGDELTGIQLVRDWLRVIHPNLDLLELPSGTYDTPGIKGDLFIGFGNPAAILRQLRAASDKSDLNRCFDPEFLAGDGDWEDLRRARELWPLLQTIDYLFDVHAVSQPNNDPFVCFGEMTPEHERLCRLIPVTRVITDPHLQLGIPEGSTCLPTTDQAVNGFGGSDWNEARLGERRGVAICYETGYEHDMDKLPLAKLVVARLLYAVEVIDEATQKRLEPTEETGETAREYLRMFDFTTQHAFALEACVLAESTNFTPAPGMQENWKVVAEGDVFGHYEDGTPVLVPTDGVLIFVKALHKLEKDKSLFYVARRLY